MVVIEGKRMKDIIKKAGPDYDNCLVNLSNSILKKYGAETTAKTLAIADEYLAKNYKNVVLILLDALGSKSLEDHLDEKGFFRSHIKHTYSSVYPATTVAATTSVLSGLYPNQHGWLGWDMFFPELDKNVTVFWNKEQLAEKEDAKPSLGEDGETLVWGNDTLAESKIVANFDAASKYIPYTNIIDKINGVGGEASAYVAMPYMEPYPKDLDEILARIKDLCNQPGKKFIYSYWNEPDATMHITGTVSGETHKMMVYLEEKLKEELADLSDTLVVITADHGHIDSKNLCMRDYPEVMDCLVRMPSIEPRALNLFVKEECVDVFPEVFKKNFGDDFLLLSKEEVLKEKLFGPGENRPGLEDMLGDYLALAIKETSIYTTHFQANGMPGGHAGLTAEEARIPLIIVES